MSIDSVPIRNPPPVVLLREAWREGKRIRNRTVANLADWFREKVEALRRLLKNEALAASEEAFAMEQSLPHGHGEAILGTTRTLVQCPAFRKSANHDRWIDLKLNPLTFYLPGSAETFFDPFSSHGKLE